MGFWNCVSSCLMLWASGAFNNKKTEVEQRLVPDHKNYDQASVDSGSLPQKTSYDGPCCLSRSQICAIKVWQKDVSKKSSSQNLISAYPEHPVKDDVYHERAWKWYERRLGYHVSIEQDFLYSETMYKSADEAAAWLKQQKSDRSEQRPSKILKRRR